MRRIILLLFIVGLCIASAQAQTKRFAAERYGGMWAGSVNHPGCHANFREWIKGGPADLRCLSDEMLASNLLDYRRGLQFTYSELPAADLRENAPLFLAQLKVLQFLELHRANMADFLRQNAEIVALRYLERRFNFTVGIVDCEANCAVPSLKK